MYFSDRCLLSLSAISLWKILSVKKVWRKTSTLWKSSCSSYLSSVIFWLWRAGRIEVSSFWLRSEGGWKRHDKVLSPDLLGCSIFICGLVWFIEEWNSSKRLLSMLFNPTTFWSHQVALNYIQPFQHLKRTVCDIHPLKILRAQGKVNIVETSKYQLWS